MAFHTVLADDFSEGYKAENWGNPFHGGTYWNGAFSWDANDVAVRDGEMQVTMTDHGGWWTAGGFNSFKADKVITYGTIEFDARVEEAQGTMTAILTWPSSDVWPRDGEIDILETPHSENMHSTHYESPGGEHWYESIRNSSFDAADWNHYELTWLPDLLRVEVNGAVVAEWTDPAVIPDVPHGFGAMGFVGSPWDSWMGGAPDASTPDQVTVHLDNVVMSQWDGQGGAPAPGQNPTPAPSNPTPTPTTPTPPVPSNPPPASGAEVHATAGADVFAFGIDAPIGGPFVIRGFEVGEDKIVAPDDDRFAADGWVYETWASAGTHGGEAGTWVQWSWDSSQRVFLAGVDASLEALEQGGATPPAEPPVEQPPVVTPPDPEPETPSPAPVPVAADIMGGEGTDVLTVGLRGVSVSGGGGADTIVLGSAHRAIDLVMNAGEADGDLVQGFQAGGRMGDVLQLHGYGEDGILTALGGGQFTAASADGAVSDTFTLAGVATLGAGDYVFG